MKKILITGKDSYIGTNIKKWLEVEEYYKVEEVSTRDNIWKEKDFSSYDTIIHVAGIAHVSAEPKLEELYYSVNRDLAIDVAKKAKQEHTKQFIFMSSMIIYGKDAILGKEKIIDNYTIPQATDFYGKSKLEADEKLQKLQDDNFKVAIIRTPMVYGPNCKGNFPRLKKIAKGTFVFPDIDNQRSMIYIDNLCEFFKQCIENNYSGIFYPQNKEYLSTKRIIEIMAESMNKKIWFTKLFNPILKLLSKKINIINKVFGSKVYKKEMSGDFSYCIVDTEESIRRSI